MLGQPTPNETAADLTHRLLGDAELRSDQTLTTSLGKPSTDRQDIILSEFGHPVAATSVRSAVANLVHLVVALGSPRDMSRVAARWISAEVARLLPWLGRSINKLGYYSVGIGDPVLATANSDATVPFELESGERPAFVLGTLLNLGPESFFKRHGVIVANGVMA